MKKFEYNPPYLFKHSMHSSNVDSFCGDGTGARSYENGHCAKGHGTDNPGCVVGTGKASFPCAHGDTPGTSCYSGTSPTATCGTGNQVKATSGCYLGLQANNKYSCCNTGIDPQSS